MRNSPSSQAYSEQTLTRIFIFVLTLHVLIWTLLTPAIRYAMSHDIIEAFVWAQNLEWGYDKNPWLIGWLARLGILLANGKSAVGF